MTDRVFLDTNVFVYLYDSDHPGKQAKARALVEHLGSSGAKIGPLRIENPFLG